MYTLTFVKSYPLSQYEWKRELAIVEIHTQAELLLAFLRDELVSKYAPDKSIRELTREKLLRYEKTQDNKFQQWSLRVFVDGEPVYLTVKIESNSGIIVIGKDELVGNSGEKWREMVKRMFSV